MSQNSSNYGVLYVVATPIGNLEEITPRAVRILSEVDLIACEDTRHTRKLTSHLQITTPLVSYYREKERQRTEWLMQKLHEGVRVALVSDAGTPCISDPGGVLVRQARKAGVKIVPISGPSALTTALSVAGLEESGFYFGGFPPGKAGTRKTFFRKLASLPCPLIFYESPHRIHSCLTDCLEVFGERNALLFRELTKVHEECREGNLSQLITTCAGKNRGEFVIIIDGAQDSAADRSQDIDNLILRYRDQKTLSLKSAVQRIAADLGLPRTQVYRRALILWKSL